VQVRRYTHDLADLELNVALHGDADDGKGAADAPLES